MRTDIKIDSRAIKCPNTSHIGFDLPVANVGNLIVYRESATSTRVARVLGRVSTLDKTVRGFALVMALSDDCSHAYERWIDPKDIIQIRNVPTDVLAFFGMQTLPDVKTVRQQLDNGTISENYLKNGYFINSHIHAK